MTEDDRWVDLEDRKTAPIKDINRLSGPKVLKSNIIGAGNGLFAEMDYEKGDVVTTYEGNIIRGRVYGDYVIWLHDVPKFKNYTINGELYFPLRAKGPWINEARGVPANVRWAPSKDAWGNVIIRQDPMGRDYPLIEITAKDFIAKDSEFLAKYAGAKRHSVD